MAQLATVLGRPAVFMGGAGLATAIGIVGVAINKLASGEWDQNGDEGSDAEWVCGYNYVKWDWDDEWENEDPGTDYYSYPGGSGFIACAILAIIVSIIGFVGHLDKRIPDSFKNRLPINLENRKNEIFGYCNLFSGIFWIIAIVVFVIDHDCYDNEDEYNDEDNVINYTWQITLYLSLLAGIILLVIGGTQSYGAYTRANTDGTANELLIEDDGNSNNIANNDASGGNAGGTGLINNDVPATAPSE